MSRGHDPRDFFLALYGDTSLPAVQTTATQHTIGQASSGSVHAPQSAVPLERAPRPYSGGANISSPSAVLALPAPATASLGPSAGQLVKAKKPPTPTAVIASPLVSARNTSPPPRARSHRLNSVGHRESRKAILSGRMTSPEKATSPATGGDEVVELASAKSTNAPDTFPLDANSPYEVLGISETATAEEVRKAYKRAALSWHPDLCTGNAEEKALATKRFQLVAEAYAVLGDRE